MAPEPTDAKTAVPGATALEVALICEHEPPAAPGDAWRARRRIENARALSDARRVRGLLLYGDRVTLIGSPLSFAFQDEEDFLLAEWVASQRTYRGDAVQAPDPPEAFWPDLEEASSDAARVEVIARIWPDRRADAVGLFRVARQARELREKCGGIVRTVEQLAHTTPGFAPVLEQMGSGRHTRETNPFDRLYGYWVHWALTTPTVIPVGVPAPNDSGLRAIEGALAAATLGRLPSFPDADLDVLLDVRDRLGPSRVRLRAALSYAAADIIAAGSRSEDALIEVRRRIIDPCLLEINEGLEDLGARPTLLRLAQSKTLDAAIGATIVLTITAARGPIELGTVAHALLGGEAAALAAKELTFRRDTRRRLRASPFWLLHSVLQRDRPSK